MRLLVFIALVLAGAYALFMICVIASFVPREPGAKHPHSRFVVERLNRDGRWVGSSSPIYRLKDFKTGKMYVKVDDSAFLEVTP